MSGQLNGKVAIITGSSRGIGRAIALELAAKGASIVLNGRDAGRLAETEELVRKHHDRVISVCCDVSVKEGGSELIERAISAFQHIDILVNNVGVSMRGTVAEVNPDVFKTVFESNVLGTVNPTIPALPYLRKTNGSVVFISSLAGIRGLPLLSAYGASKMALRGIAESIRIEEAKHNVHVGLIYVAMTEIAHNKEAIGADGSMVVLDSRKSRNVQSTASVAKAVVRNIQRRKFISTLTCLGKLNAFLQARFPSVVEKIILMNIKKFEEGSK